MHSIFYFPEKYWPGTAIPNQLRKIFQLMGKTQNLSSDRIYIPMLISLKIVLLFIQIF